MTPRLETSSGHDLLTVSSLLQKSLRRGDVVLAARAVNELLPKYPEYTWRRLLTVSAEDCGGLITQEVMALRQAWSEVHRHKKDRTGRVFFSKAVVLLARARHSRDADELNLLVSDRLPAEEFAAALDEANDDSLLDEIPAYAYDVHTRAGKRAGKTRRDFVIAEHEALSDGTSMFRNWREMAESETWVEPQLDWTE